MTTRHEVTCRELVEGLLQYLSGGITGRRRGAFEVHLGVCEECRAYLRGYEETVRLGRDAFEEPGDPIPPEVPEDLVQAVLAARRTRQR